MKHIIISLGLLLAVSNSALAQERTMTREQILAMTTDELAELPLEDLMKAVELLGVSSIDELFALIMNKNVSSASKMEENAFVAPLSSTVITHDEMRTYGVSTIEEALRLIPGMIVAEKSNGIFDVQMRGLANIPDNNLFLYSESMNILVMVDGRVVHSYAIGTPNLDNLPISIEDIERLEVVRGATSALYGPNAVQGVINIITRKADRAGEAVNGNFRVGNKVMQGDLAIRRNLSDKVALGLTYNINRRWRWTDKMIVVPSTNKYICYDGSGVTGRRYTLAKEDLVKGLTNGTIKDISAGYDISMDEMKHYYTISGTTADGYIFSLNGHNNPDESYPDPTISRRNDAFNGYLTLKPANDIRIDFTGGYQYSTALNTQLGQENVSFRTREFSTYYAAVEANIKDLKVLANYNAGCSHFCVGAPGFQMKQKLAQLSAEYTINVGDLAIKPALGYKKMHIKDHEPEYIDYLDGKGTVETSGFWGYYSQGNNTAENDDIEASVRLDYKHDGLRLIGAGRFDKTSIPDDWNPSWQFVASYQLDDHNFFRINYGRARRSTVFFHSSSNYNWHNSGVPNYIQFLGNEDSPLVKIDNFEFGYRLKPIDRLLIDFEAFYSISDDYGVLKAHSAVLTLPEQTLNAILTGVANVVAAGGDLSQFSSHATSMTSMFGTKGYVQYGDMPFKVFQKGLSMNIDWIISPKLIAKLNANVQQTRIDNYFVYSQTNMFSQMFANCSKNISGLMGDIITNVVKTVATGGSAQDYLNGCLGYTPVGDRDAMYKAMSDEEKAAYCNELLAKYQAGETLEDGVRPLGLYYALKYGVRYDKTTNEYHLGSSEAVDDAERQNNFKHEATPSLYGSVGLIYRPIDKLTFATMGYYSGKKRIDTTYGQGEVDKFFTLNLRAAYKPIDKVEIYCEAHNLLNNSHKEMPYCDNLKGVYSFGMNFGF